ncbi:hypothetical protein ACI782_09750 [Geodermatophilus sp. SYSU D00703]
MPLSAAETCARIAAELNRPGQPFTYRCEGDRVIGSWDVADVSYQGLLSAGTIDQDYELTVTLDEQAGTYTSTERRSEGESQVRFSGGDLEFGGSKQVFKGKSIGRSWGGGAALRATSHGQTGHTWSYEFETSRIKQPLFDLLHAAGWQPARKGFLARLFSR